MKDVYLGCMSAILAAVSVTSTVWAAHFLDAPKSGSHFALFMWCAICAVSAALSSLWLLGYELSPLG